MLTIATGAHLSIRVSRSTIHPALSSICAFFSSKVLVQLDAMLRQYVVLYRVVREMKGCQ
jgi:hypothetical protein